MPFAEDVFDVAISNHVIEHVGGHNAQQAHVAEIVRVLRPGGQAYLVFPNCWQMVEPYYGLAFLSWLPRQWRTPYLRRAGRGEMYGCDWLSLGEVEPVLAGNACVEAIWVMVEVEGGLLLAAAVCSRLPAPLLASFKAVCRTYIYLLQVPGGS